MCPLHVQTVAALTLGNAKKMIFQLHTPCLKKVGQFYFHNNFGNSGPIFIFFTIRFRKNLWRKLKLKLPPPLKAVSALPCKTQVISYTALHFILARICFISGGICFMSFYYFI